MLRISAILFILSIFILSGFAQRVTTAKIITLNNDTINGYIEKVNKKAYLTAINFFPKKNALSQYFPADSLKGFITDGNLYLSVDTDTDEYNRFLKLMVDGSTQMFAHLNEYGEYDYYFKKPGEKAEKHDEKSPWHFLSGYFYDCDGLIFKSRKKIYTRNELIDIVNQYNNCENKYYSRSTKIMADSRTTLEITTGLRGVYSINHFRSTHPVISTYQGSKNIGANLFINLDFGGRLCFQPEIMYVKRDAYTLTQYNTYKIERWYDFDLLQLPVLAHYKLLEGKTEI